MAFQLALNEEDDRRLAELAKSLDTTRHHTVELLIRASDKPVVRKSVSAVRRGELA